MSDSFRKVATGEPLRFPARLYNTLVEMAADYEARRFDSGGNRGAGPRGTVLVRNDSGADRDQFDVLGVSAPLILPSANEKEFRSRVAFKGISPTVADHLGRFAVLLEPVKQGDIGPACVAGVCIVHVDVQDEDHEYADIADGRYRLATSDSGTARILWKEGGTGTKWAVVRLGAGGAAAAVAWGKPQTTPSLSDGWNSFDVDVYAEKECTTDTGRDATVRFHKSPGLLVNVTGSTPLGFMADSAGENIVVHWPRIPQATTATVRTKPTFPLSAGPNTVEMTLDATGEDVTVWFWESAKNVLWDEDDFDVGDGPYVVVPVWTGSAVQWWLAGAGGPGSAWFYGDDP